MRFALLLLGLASCGDPNDPACSIRCDDTGGCPTGLVCSAGFCAADGATCEPAFERVAAGAGFACALDQFHHTWCWGSNADRQIEDSDTIGFSRAVAVGDRRWDSISVGGGHVCAIENRELWCWGRNDRNQVSNTVVGDVGAPLRIELAGETAEWSYVSAGFDDTCAITSGRVFCWGAGDVGKLGTGDANDAETPRPVSTDLRDWRVVAAGLRHTCGVSASAGAFCWGDGSSGQLGAGTFNVKSTPQPVDLAGVATIAVGLDSTCAVTTSGELACWGRTQDGALGDPAVIDPTGPNVSTPVSASSLGGWDDVAVAEHYACGRRDGEVYCWGTALAGGIGDGHWASSRTFTHVLDGATAIGVGWNATASDRQLDDGDLDLACAIVDREVRCWGDNRFGQLGQGGATRSLAPAEIAGGHAWTSLVAGPAHACGIAAGEVACWGSSELGQATGVAVGGVTPCTPGNCDVGAPAALVNGATSLATGFAHTCALGGLAVSCWGDNAIGQLGGNPGPMPWHDIAGTFTALYGGANGGCATSAAQTTCWGDAFGVHAPAPEAPLDGATAIVLGVARGCILDASGALACFGDSANGTFGNGAPGTCGDNACNNFETVATCAADCGPAPLTHLKRTYTAIASGTSPFTCGLRADARIECWGDNRFGQSGEIQDNFLIHPVTIPFAIPNLAACTQLATGETHACALCGGALACWGDARHGELGPPITSEPITIPRTIAAPSGDPWIAVTAGSGFTCARTQSSKGYCWGTSSHGALGGAATSANLPVTVQH